MLETFLLVGSIILLILFSIAFKERAIMYKNYPTSCDTIYIPKKEKILLGPSIFNSSPNKIKTKEIRRYELQNMIPIDNSPPYELRNIILKDEYSKKEIEIYFGISDFNSLTPEQLIEIILNIESGEFKENENFSENYNILEKIYE